MGTIKIIFIFILIFIVSINGNAQWTTDTVLNTLVADSEVGDMQAIGSSEGKTYVVFWKSVAPPVNYELRLQILNVDGFQLLGNDGMLVSDAIPMSTYTVIWSIVTDNEDNLYIGITGTGSGEPAFVFKLDAEGNHLWGPNGVNVATGYSVTVLPLSTGEAIVSWFPEGESVMQKYDASGNAIWGSTQSIIEGGNNTVPANMFELTNGDYIMIFHSLTFGINSNLFAQRYNSSGVLQWTNPTQISNYGTVFNTTYDGLQDGDVVYMGYKASPGNRFDSFLQRIDADGTLPWGINGSDFDTNQTDYEMDTKIAFKEGSAYIWSSCNYTNTSQSEKGEYIQKFDKETGARMFTDNAKEIFPIGSEKVHAGSMYLINDFPLLLIKDGLDNGVSPTSLHALMLDENGDFAWPEETRPLAIYSANKRRIQFTKPANNQSVTVFIEDKGAGSKIYAQNFTEEILAINDHEFESNLSFVNPVTTNLEVKFKNTISAISIYNILGQTIFELKNNSSNEVSINTENWNSGVYLMKLYSDVGVVLKQIIKN
ncbi:MAG: T9SS type A sorting domain-containing protein [Flavobacteriales bacterium]